MKKSLILFLFIAIIIGSCTPATASPTPPQPATASPTIVPSEIPPPTQTEIPTATPYPPLQTDGPYLLFTYDNKNFTIMDADGSGQKQFQLPNDGYIRQLNRSVSPNGKLLAFFTGSTEEPYDIALHLLNLLDGTTQKISKLIAPNFPENLEPVMETMLFSENDECSTNMECSMKLLQRSFTNGIYALDWSPNGLFLAFAAQIEGASSDLHIYSVQDKTIRRITDDLQNIESINWAPNKNKIIYSNSVPGSLYAGRTVHIADPKDMNVQTPQKLIDADDLWGEYGWMSENLYIFYEWTDTDPPISNINILNTDTGQIKNVWPYTADFFAVNKEANILVLMHRNHRTQKPTVPDGIYIIYPSGKYQKISNIEMYFVLMEGENPYPVLAQGYNGKFYNIGSNNSIKELPWSNDSRPIISPDGKFLFFRERNSLELFTDSYQSINSWSKDEGVYQITWRPDSLGVFFSTENDIRYLNLLNKEIYSLALDCSPARCADTRFIWLH